MRPTTVITQPTFSILFRHLFLFALQNRFDFVPFTDNYITSWIMIVISLNWRKSERSICFLRGSDRESGRETLLHYYNNCSLDPEWTTGHPMRWMDLSACITVSLTSTTFPVSSSLHFIRCNTNYADYVHIDVLFISFYYVILFSKQCYFFLQCACMWAKHRKYLGAANSLAKRTKLIGHFFESMLPNHDNFSL